MVKLINNTLFIQLLSAAALEIYIIIRSLGFIETTFLDLLWYVGAYFFVSLWIVFFDFLYSHTEVVEQIRSVRLQEYWFDRFKKKYSRLFVLAAGFLLLILLTSLFVVAQVHVLGHGYIDLFFVLLLVNYVAAGAYFVIRIRSIGDIAAKYQGKVSQNNLFLQLSIFALILVGIAVSGKFFTWPFAVAFGVFAMSDILWLVYLRKLTSYEKAYYEYAKTINKLLLFLAIFTALAPLLVGLLWR